MKAILDPEYIDELATEIVSLDLEVEQMRVAVAEQVRAREVAEVFKASCKQMVQYIEKRTERGEHLRDVAAKYGTYCRETGGRVLVGTQFVVYQKFDRVTIVACIQSEVSAPTERSTS